MITDPLQIAKAFNDYFCEVAGCDDNRMDMEDFTGHPSIISDVSPIYKKSDETNKANYCPALVLTALSKVYERVMFDQFFGSVCYILSPKTVWLFKGSSLMYSTTEND